MAGHARGGTQAKSATLLTPAPRLGKADGRSLCSDAQREDRYASLIVAACAHGRYWAHVVGLRHPPSR